jgi:hypothetical protein
MIEQKRGRQEYTIEEKREKKVVADQMLMRNKSIE